ncbi:MAG: hypothetical protein LBU43_05825 [Candidatus Accumulibacter sp.]|jgi:hypothetical protein|nr:hypothetical protein [Accumulibacter sp.]
MLIHCHISFKWWALVCLAGFFVSGCSPTKDQPPSVSQNQDMKVVASFYHNTGGDIWLDGPAGPYKLELRLEFIDPDSNEKIVVQDVIAECGRMSGGTVFGDKTEREIDVTLCEGDERYADDERYAGIDKRNAGIYWLISEPGELTVRKGWLDVPQKIIATYRMPSPGIRAVTKEEE